MTRIKILLSFLMILTIGYSQSLLSKRNQLFRHNTNQWEQTNGPGGGFINDIVFNPTDPSNLYAIGSSAGIYKTLDNGDIWELIKFDDQGHADDLEITQDGILFCNYHSLSKSNDGGVTWQKCSSAFDNLINTDIFKIDPETNDIYVAGRYYDSQGVAIYKSEDLGDSWTELPLNITIPAGSEIATMALCGSGKIFIGINDRQLLTWHKGKIFYTDNDGANWQEIEYGSIEDRFIWSILANPVKPGEIWLSEGPLYNESIDRPWLYISEDNGDNWEPLNPNLHLDPTQVRALGVSADGNNIYIAGGGYLCYTNDKGGSFHSINLPSEIMRFDLWNLAPHPNQSSTIFLPTGSGGVAYSSDNGSTWIQKNNGILSTSINILAPDPKTPGRIYCASWIGEGLFRTDDYGQNWNFLNKGGIIHPWDDELLIDPIEPNNIWFIPDVPYIHKSSDFGNNWDVLSHPYNGENFNFSSVSAMTQSYDENMMYAVNSGFGIFRGVREYNDAHFNWEYLNLSDVDYSYTLAVSQTDPNIIFSGYSRKPFESNAKIQGSLNGGENWFTSLEVDGAEAITSVIIDHQNESHLLATSVGLDGGIIWQSEDLGSNWNKINDYFNFTTIHAFAVSESNPSIAFAGVWGGGTYKTEDSGETWSKLESEVTFSAAAIAIDPSDPNIIYLADRTNPILYKSNDGGNNWENFFDAGSEFRRLMCVTIDPGNTNTVYVSAMKMGGPGKLGALFKISDGITTDINGSIPKVPLAITVDPTNSDNLYTVLHESGVYKSIDGGNSWSDISGATSNLPESGFNKLVISPTDANKLYLLGGCDVRFSDFESAGLGADIVNGVYQSDDQGATWTNINHDVLGNLSGGVKNLVFSKTNSEVIYLGCENGVYYSIDNGESWQKSEGLPYETLGGIEITEISIYAFTNGAGIFTGTIQSDYSITWQDNQKINAPIYFAQLLKDLSDESTIYASAYPGGIFKTTDNGITWHEKNFGLPSFKVDDPLRQGYYAFDQSPSNPKVMYLGLFEKGVYRSFNGGDTWYPVNGQQWEMFGKKITSLVIGNNNENQLYVGTEEGIFTTSNGEKDWSEMNNGLVSRDIKTLYISQNDQLYAGSRGYGLYQWLGNEWMGHHAFGNWGVIWPMWADRPMYQYSSLLIHPNDNSRMIFGTFPQGIYKSNDFGDNWKESNIGWTNDGVFSLICHPDNPEIVYAGTYNGINKSYDFGSHWERKDSGMPGEQWVFSIDFDPTNPDIMYACSKNGQNEGLGIENFHGTVMKSIDGGENWFEITEGIQKDDERPNQEFYKIIVDQYDPNTIYLASQRDGIYISKNGGNYWTMWNEGLENPVPGTNGNNVTNTLILSSDHSMLYFGSDGSGVWRRMIAPILPINNLSAKVKNNSIILKWNFDDIKNNFNQFNVYRSQEYFEDINQISPIATITNISDSTFIDENVIEGTQYYYAVTTSDHNNYENEHIYVLGPIVVFSINIATVSLDSGQVNIEYSDTLHVNGGMPPYYWEKTSGDLPKGISISNNGIISGIPKQDGEFQFQIIVEDSQNFPATDSLLYQLYIKPEFTKIDDNSGMPKVFALNQNYPNPFNNNTRIQYDVPKYSDVKIEIYNINGEFMHSLVNEFKLPGTYYIDWNCKTSSGYSLPSGIYFLQMKATNYIDTKQMILLK
jgi:photosystem II stability/assembly factor-like uncharacterized protein